MSDTNKISDRAIAYGDIKANEKGEIALEQGKYGPSKVEVNELAGMNIPFGLEKKCKIERNPDGTIRVNGKTITLDKYNDNTLSAKIEVKARAERATEEEQK